MADGTALSNQGFGPGQKYYDASIYANNANFGTVFKVAMRSSNTTATEKYRINGMDNCGKWWIEEPFSNSLFAISQPHDFDPCNIVILNADKVPHRYYTVSLRSNADLPALDNAPAGYRTDLTTIHASIQSGATAGDVTFNNPIRFPILSFVQTYSALAMATPLTNPNLFVDLTATEFDNDNLPNVKVPHFDRKYAPPANLRHVELDAGMVDVILDELDRLASNLATGTLAEEYNYGLAHKMIPNTTVDSTGILNINNPGPTGYVQRPNPGGAAVKPVFTTYLNECGQQITVDSGGHYNIGAINKSQHGITEVWEGASVHIKAGGTLHITSDQSMLWIKPGAILTLDAGAIVQLESPTSNIRIDGLLIVNGNFTFQGRGHFDFHNDYGLRLGSNADAFRVSAPPISRRSIRLSANTRLHIPEGKGIDLNYGGVEYALDNTLLLEPGAWAEANSAWFVGLDKNATGVSGENPGRLIVENSFFVNVDAPVDISGANNFGTDLTRFKNTRFEEYNIGSHIGRRGVVLFDHCSLLGTGSEAEYGVFSEDNVAFILRESSISGHTFGNPVVPDMALSYGLRTGIKVERGWLVWMDGGEISGCDLGIANYDQYDEGTAVRVVMNHFATIRDCGLGIIMKGDDTKGLVMMDCARLINNGQGIFGDDIRLLIDPEVIAKQNGTPANPNIFTLREIGSNANKYFNICYKQFPSPGQPIPAKMNYWGVGTVASGGITIANPAPLTDIVLNRPLGNTPCASPVAMDVSSAVTRPPVGCDMEEFCDPNSNCLEDCSIPFLTGGSTTVKSRFVQGYEQLKEEQFDNARSDFGDVAGLWQPDLTDDGYDQYCQTLIHASRSLSEGGAPNLLRSTPVHRFPAGTVRIQPNPTFGTFSVALPAANCTLRVWDAYGRMVYEQINASGATFVDASGWATGMYAVEVTSVSGKEWGKLMIQR